MSTGSEERDYVLKREEHFEAGVQEYVNENMRRLKETHPLVLRAESVRLDRDAIGALAGEIPADAERLDGLLAECIEGYYARAFTAMALAALHAGIPVDARHLVEGARLLPDPGLICKASAHVTGDVVGALVGAVADGRLSWEREAVVLFLAAHWSREREMDRHRGEIVRRTRMLARVGGGPQIDVFLAATSDVLEDDELSGLIDRLPAGVLRPLATSWTQGFLDLARSPLLQDLRDADPALPAPRRRAVRRVGRNEPCPCGSGRKYKRCCEAKDQERLRDSSDVAGLTLAELRLHLEDHLTRERVRSLRAHELARLDPKRIDPSLHGIVLNQLITFEEWGALVDFFEAAGDGSADGSIEGYVIDAASGALRAGRPDVARTFVKMAGPSREDWLGFYERLLSEGQDHAPALDMLEAEARKVVDGLSVDLACDLLASPWPCLGILVGRGAAALAEPWDRETLLEAIGLARDRLDLPALDPTEHIEDLWGWSEESDPLDDAPAATEPSRTVEPAPHRDAALERGLAEKEAEVAKLRQELSDLHRKLDEHLEAAAPRAGDSGPSPQAPVEDPRVAKFKERVAALKGELTQRHSERNQLRRQLEQTRKRLTALESERAAAIPGAEDDDADDVDADPVDASVALSFRIPVFGRRFRTSAARLPEHVRRRAVIVASRIAAGDEAALRGARRLRLDRELFRQRVGREYRLIFRLNGDELESVDLVPRKDLERTVRELARG